MRTIAAALAGIASVALFAGSRMAEQTGASILRQLGMDPAAAPRGVWSSFSGGMYALPRTAQLKNLPKSEQGKAGRDLMIYARSVTESPEFQKWYTEHREQNKPKPPEPPKSTAEQKKEMKEAYANSIADMEKSIAQLPADQKEVAKMLKESVNQARQQMKELDDPKNPMFTPEMDQMYRQMHDQAVAAHREKLAEWEAGWPAKPDKLVARRLREFVALTQEVDYDAKLVDGPKGVKQFANPAYESKSSQWKMCFRAGREATTAARQYAEEWLKALK